ncbi:hypothetical protein AVEN_167148-1 [Araneus ventricosus]|uniref:Uncharacterized protein n=1 Tax=Araneus ventricosus TaxID=182803 RepID=A0A4Y2E5S2_ARAVE|nr:hypothetical protein AVEN_267524-1 [Araneus ventricosus]GBM23679.1 hypothetical protein AVEN_57206-1 [Araneus ventricosus]GBM23686.1 hypothetical protein AVEN_58652-1 [Araneus ventricosus]GBM23714.1 hypothetical protein AVEN_167148-1 [Araneus ventricosus]
MNSMVIEAFVPSVNQSIETGVEENKIQVTESLNYGFLNFGIGSEMASGQVLPQRSEEMTITCCESGLWWTCLAILTFARLAHLLCLVQTP